MADGSAQLVVQAHLTKAQIISNSDDNGEPVQIASGGHNTPFSGYWSGWHCGKASRADVVLRL